MKCLTFVRFVVLFFFSVPKDRFVHKPGEGPSSFDLTGEHSDGEKSSSNQIKEKTAKPASSATPLQKQVKGNHTPTSEHMGLFHNKFYCKGN